MNSLERKEEYRKDLDAHFEKALVIIEKGLAPDDERREPMCVRKMACVAAIDQFISEQNKRFLNGAPTEALQVCADLMAEIKAEEAASREALVQATGHETLAVTVEFREVGSEEWETLP